MMDRARPRGQKWKILCCLVCPFILPFPAGPSWERFYRSGNWWDSEAADFFCKGPNRKCFKHCVPQGLLCVLCFWFWLIVLWPFKNVIRSFLVLRTHKNRLDLAHSSSWLIPGLDYSYGDWLSLLSPFLIFVPFPSFPLPPSLLPTFLSLFFGTKILVPETSTEVYSSTISWSLLRFMSTEPVMLFDHLILCCLLLLLPSIFPSIIFSNELVFLIRWPKYWSFSFSNSPSNKYSRLISFMTDWFDLLAVQGTLKSLLRLCASTSGDTGLIPGQGIKILHAVGHCQNKLSN